jgi:hypothetical protein
MAKLTFEAQMKGFEQLNDMFKKIEESLYDVSHAGNKGFDEMNSKVKALHDTLGNLTKSQDSIGRILKEYTNVGDDTIGIVRDMNKGIVSAMKEGTAALKNEISNIRSMIRDEQNNLATLKANSKLFTEEERQQMHGEISKRITTLQGMQVTAATSVADAERQQAYKASFVGKMGDYLGTKVNLPFGAQMTRGALIGGAAALPGAVLGISSYAVTEQMNPQRTFMAQRDLAMQTAGRAMEGDPTLYMMQQMGLGAANATEQSMAFKAKTSMQFLMQNPLGGAVMGGLAGFKLGGPWGALAGAAAGAFAAPNKTYDTVLAEAKMQLREEDQRMGETVFKTASEGYRSESRNLDLAQRSMGREEAQRLTRIGYRAGLLSEETADEINAIAGLGASPYMSANYLKLRRRYGVSGAMMDRLNQTTALSGNSEVARQDILQMYANAGMYGSESYGSRMELSNFMASMMQGRGPGTSAADVGGTVSTLISQGTGNIGLRTKSAIQAVSTLNEMKKGPTALNALETSTLMSMGITDPFIIQSLIRRGLGTKEVQQDIANATGIPLPDVQAKIGGINTTMLEQAKNFGTETSRQQAAKMKRDYDTMVFMGDEAAERAAQGVGYTYKQTLAAEYGTKSAGKFNLVQETYSQADVQAAGKASEIEASYKNMEKMISEVGGDLSKTVIQAINESISFGFNQAVMQMDLTTKQLLSEKKRDQASKSKVEAEEIKYNALDKTRY